MILPDKLHLKMDAPGILTTCAACAAPLAHDAPRCVRCKLRYCNATCQHDHWRRGHKQMCKKIHRGGNAEQYHADKKYKEAVAEAVEACADDTKGQGCLGPHAPAALTRGPASHHRLAGFEVPVADQLEYFFEAVPAWCGPDPREARE